MLAAGAVWALWASPAGDVESVLGLLAALWPPRSPAAAFGGRTAAAIGLAFLLFLSYDAAGCGLSRWISPARPRGALRMAAPFLGYGAVSLALLGLSAVGLWFAPVLWASLLVVGAAGRRRGWLDVAVWTGVLRSAWDDAPPWGRVLGAAILGWACILLAAPEVHVDSLEYHLAFSQQVLGGHRLIGRDAYLHWMLSLAADLPNVFPLLAGLDPAARMLRPVFAAAGGLALLRAAGAGLAPSAGVAAVWLGVMLPGAALTLFTAKNDSIVCGGVLVALAAALGVSSRRMPGRSVVAAGCAAGLLVSMKLVAAPFAAAVAGFALGRAKRSYRWRAAGMLVAGVLAPVVPWAAKSWLFTGDPVYPLGAGWIPGVLGDAGYGSQMGGALARYTAWGGRLAAWPWELSSIGIASALPALAVVPVVLSSGRSPLRTAFAVAWAGTGLLVVSRTFGPDAMDRFAGPGFAAVNMLACIVVLAGRGPAWRAARVALIALAVVSHLRVTRQVLGPNAAATGALLAGRMPPEVFRLDALGSYGRILPVVRRAVQSAGPRAHVLEVGETMSWGVPARVIGEGLGPRLPWQVARETDSDRRMSIRFRQAGVRWVLYNAWKASWARLDEEPYAWDSRMLRRYEAWARRHLRLRAASGREDPVFGSHWFFEVVSAPTAPRRRILFLPGAERALAAPTRAAVRGDFGRAVEGFRALRRSLPGVVALDAVLGHALVRAGRWEEAYPLIRSSVDAGLVYELNLFDWAIVAGRLGRRAEAREALRRAARAFPGRPDLLEHARRNADQLE